MGKKLWRKLCPRVRLQAHSGFGSLYAWLGYAYGCAVLGLLFLGAEKFTPWLHAKVPSEVTRWASLLIPIGVAITAVLRKHIGRPAAWQTLNATLDEKRREMFKDFLGEQERAHRITLFQRRGWSWHPRCWCWPWSGWLVPVARSGANKDASSVFRAPDGPDVAAGIAGCAWDAGSTVFARGKDVPMDLPRSGHDHEQVSSYAAATKVSETWVREQLEEERPLKTSFAAFPVETSRGRWGVVVLDSVSRTALDDHDSATYVPLAKEIARILKLGEL